MNRWHNIKRFVYEIGNKRGFLGFLLLLVLDIGCRQQPADQMVITQVVMTENTPIVVTRLIQPMIPVEQIPTPLPASAPATESPITFNINYQNSLPLIDPQLATEAETITLIQNLYAQLTRYNSQEKRIEPQLALQWHVTDDGLLWTFTLRDDLYWMHVAPDGTIEQWRNVTAEDVVTAFRRVCDPRVGSPTAFVLFIVQGCEAVNRTPTVQDSDLAVIAVQAIDDFTVQIRLVEPASYFLTITSLWWLTPLPAEKFLEFADPFEDDDRWNAPANLVTSGAYLLVEGSLIGERTYLQRNPLWALPVAGNIEAINILHLAPEVAFELWQKRGLDVAIVPREYEEQIPLNRSRYRLISDNRVFYLAYNFESEVFRHPEMRRAFGSAADRERLIEEVYEGRAFPMRHFAPPGTIGAPLIDEVGNGYNRDYARLQISASPFADCRLMPPIHYLVSTTDLALQHAQALKQIWTEELNCPQEQIIIEQVQFGALVARTRPDSLNRPDMWDLGWASYFPDEQDWVGNILYCRGAENRMKRPCSEVDTWIENAGNTANLDERWQLYREIERQLFARDGIEPISPMVNLAEYRAVHRWMSNYQPPHFGGEQYDSYLIDTALRELELID